MTLTPDQQAALDVLNRMDLLSDAELKAALSKYSSEDIAAAIREFFTP